MELPPDPDWYLDNVLALASPGTARLHEPGPIERWRAWWSEQATDGSALSTLAREQGFVVAPGQLEVCGVSRQQARSRVARGTWCAPLYGAVAPVDVRDADPFVVRRRRHALAMAAGVLRHADHVGSGRSAAIAHGLPTYSVPSRPELTDAEPTGLGRRSGAHLFGATLTFDEVTNWYGAPIVTPARALVDLARHDRRDAIMAVDAAFRERLVTLAELDTALGLAAGWPGIRQAREVLALADGRSESPLESLTRLRLIEDGFPPPELQVWFGPYRADLVIEEWRLIIEVDGLGKYTDAEIRREKRREQRLRAFGYRVERVTWDDIVLYWPQTRVRLLSAANRLPA